MRHWRSVLRVVAAAAAAALVFLLPPPCSAQNVQPPSVLYDVRDRDTFRPEWIALPFAFSTDSFKFTVGLGGGGTGYLQKQAGLYGAALTTANDTHAFYFIGTNIRVPGTRRLFFDLLLSAGYYTDVRDYYGTDNPGFTGERAGSNESSEENFLTSRGEDTWAEATFKYVLPLGGGRESGFLRYTLDRGLPASEPLGGTDWNPLESGLIMITLEPFYRFRTFEFGDVSGSGDTSGLKFGLIRDNRDFPPNPERGSRLNLAATRDFGWLDSLNSYTVLEGSISKYLPLGPSRLFRQQVLALTAWTADNTTWKEISNGEAEQVEGRAPAYRGASLGGFYRLRAYPSHRFHDKAAVYYGAELRLMPRWNPLREVKFLGFLEVDWIQVVGILEAGRVAPQWELKKLHEEMKWDAGAGLRAMMRKVVVRLDACAAEDAFSVWAMAGHPF